MPVYGSRQVPHHSPRALTKRAIKLTLGPRYCVEGNIGRNLIGSGGGGRAFFFGHLFGGFFIYKQ